MQAYRNFILPYSRDTSLEYGRLRNKIGIIGYGIKIKKNNGRK